MEQQPQVEGGRERSDTHVYEEHALHVTHTRCTSHVTRQTHSPLARSMPSFTAPFILGRDKSLMLVPASDCSRHHMQKVLHFENEQITRAASHFSKQQRRIRREIVHEHLSKPKMKQKTGYVVLGGGYHLPREFEVLSGVRAQQLQQLVQKLSEKARQTLHVTRHKSHDT